MVPEILDALKPAPGEIAIDCTLGYGGHASEILRRILPGGRLIGIDADPLEIERTTARLRAAGFGPESFQPRNTNFAALAKILAGDNLSGADMILADLGVSSMQLDNPSRGFSYKLHGPLDLRMNPNKGQSAADYLAGVKESDLADLLSENSDEPHAQLLASALVASHSRAPLRTTTDLANCIENALRPHASRTRRDETAKSIRRVFQALRIAVNNELAALDNFLRVLPATLLPGGRVAILTFHSGEDRRVKKTFQEGHRQGLYSAISEEPARPSAAELRDNPRSSSAKLRWAIRGKNQSTVHATAP